MPFEDSVGALKELQDEGKIRHIGVSNVSVEELETARELVDVVTVQNRFNLEDRHSEDVLDACEQAGIGFIPWFPLAVGRLARPGGPLDEVARDHDATPGPGGARVAARPLRRDAADPGNGLDRAPRGERGGRRPAAERADELDQIAAPRTTTAAVRRPRPWPSVGFEAGLSRVAQRCDRLLARKALEGTVLELAHALAREPEAATGLA